MFNCLEVKLSQFLFGLWPHWDDWGRRFFCATTRRTQFFSSALYKTQGHYALAEPLYKRALAIWEKALGPDHPAVATSLNNLGELYRAQGRYAQAEPLYKRALAIWEKALGPDHPSVATSRIRID